MSYIKFIAKIVRASQTNNEKIQKLHYARHTEFPNFKNGLAL